MTGAPEVEGSDDLYSLDLDQFVAARDRLADRLSSEGETEQAASVAKLRKPSVAAWALNRATRRDPQAVQRLLASHRRLRAAASAEELQEASAERREAASELELLAVAELKAEGRPTSGSSRDKIATTLLAIANDPEGEEDLASARLTRELEPSSGGWGETGFVAKSAKDPAARIKAATDKVRARAEKLRKEAERAEQRVESAQRALDEAKSQAEQRREAADRAEAELREAEAAGTS